MIVNSSQGGGSKDTWVLDDGDLAHALPVGVAAREPPRLAGCPLRRLARPGPAAAVSVLARIAQELFWLGRDLTRAEHTARMLDGAFHADVAGGAAGAGAGAQSGIALSWNGVLAVIGAKPPAPGEEAAEGAVAEAAGHAPPGMLGRHEIAPLLTLDTDSPASVVSCVYRARERARTLRDVISD